MTEDELDDLVAEVLTHLEPVIRRYLQRAVRTGAEGARPRQRGPQREVKGVCEYKEGGMVRGWCGYYSDGTRQIKKRFSFAEYGDQAKNEAIKWRRKQMKNLRA
jgi:hypothetical protein